MNASQNSLKDVTTKITKGTTPTTLGFQFTETGIPFVRVNNLIGGHVDFKDNVLYIDKLTDEKLARSRIQPNDVLLSMAGTIGRSSIVSKDAPPMNCNQAVCIIRCTPELDVRYLKHWLGTADAQRQMAGSKVTGVISNLSLTQIRGLFIPLPTISEQKWIAAILGKADALREKRRQAIAKLDELLQSVFLDMFGDPVTNPMGWDVVTVGELAEFITSGSRGWAKYYAENGSLFLRIQNLQKGKLVLDDVAFVEAPDSAEAKRTKVYPNDILVSITADLGRVAVVPNGLGKAHVNQHIAILRLRDIESVYVANYLASAGGKIQFGRLNRQGVKAGLNFDDLRRISLLRPPAELQKKFIQRLHQIESMHEKSVFSNTKLDTLFSSLQQQAFKGEL